MGEGLEQIFKDAMEAVDGGDFVNNVLDGLGVRGARKKYTRTTNAQGKLTANWVDDFWGPRAQALDSNVALLRNMIDPYQSISSSALKKMTIGDVRTILSKSTVGVDRVDELRRAVAWLIIRDVQASPQVLLDIATLQSSKGTAKVSATAERFWKLKSYMEKSAEISEHLKKSALEGTFSGKQSELLGGELAPIFRQQSKGRIASLPEEIAELETTLIKKQSELNGLLSEQEKRSLNYDISKLEQELNSKRYNLKVGQSSGRGTDQIRMVATAQHLEKAMVERNQVFEDLQSVISEISFQEGITPGQSISVLVNDLLDRNPLQLNEVVSNGDIDSVLISIRSSKNTTFDIEPPSFGLEGDRMAEEGLFSGDLLQTEIPGVIESMRGIMNNLKILPKS
jgi:hypothetical protein